LIGFHATVNSRPSYAGERRYVHLFDRQRTDEAVRRAMVF
jgi:hypothetical protein